MRGLGFVKNLEIIDRNERIMLYIPTMVFFFWTYQVLNKEYHEFLSDVLLGAFLGVAVAFVINAVKDKISAHAIGMGGLFSIAVFASKLAVYNIAPIIMGVIVLAGIVGTSRLVLNAHTNREVYSGYLVGFLCMSLALIF